MAAYLSLLLISAIVAYAVTPAVLALSRKIGAVDIPDDRKVHAVPTPTLGGTAIYLGVVVATIAGAGLKPFAASFTPLFVWPLRELVAILLGTTIMFILGVVDDLKGLKAPAKLSGQVLAGGLVFLSGVRLEYFRFPAKGVGALSLDANLSAIATILWIVIIVNAVNLMDGLDGLAAGITAIAGGAFFIYTFELGRQGLTGPEPTAQLISIVIVGGTLGFLRYNFNPAKIFMGDSGSMTLGFLLATATVAGVGRSATANSGAAFLFYLPLAIPLIVLAIPILDTILAVGRRLGKGQHVFHADREHLHHRLLEIGHGHRQAVLIMYAWTGIIAGTTLALTFARGALIPFLGAAIGLVLYTLLPRLARPRP
ncbi:MAG: glycosyltransferase family 4 protein [Actinomycetota bacterium]